MPFPHGVIGTGSNTNQLTWAPMSSPTKRRRLKVFFDGGCRPNPGRIEAAVVVRGVSHLFDDLGQGTNSDAEWLALICALEVTHSMNLADIELIGDAIEVVRNANRALSIGCATDSRASAFLALCAGRPKPRIRWIKREQNLAGIALAARHPR
jgi:ribonuclease HI